MALPPRFRYPLPYDVVVGRLVSMSTSSTSPGQALHNGAVWKRIDALCRSKKVTTQQLAAAASVTWAAAKRWRLPPEKKGAMPTGENLRAIAGVLGVTTDELLGIYDGNEPTSASWTDFKKTRVYAQLTEKERVRVAATPFVEDAEPDVEAWISAGQAHINARKRAS